eukprot:13052741-Alexandrium_andersonii.AAC.1
MSASLVGLGDVYKRQGQDLPALPPGWRDHGGLERGGAGLPPSLVRGEPVSYTHLTLPTICSV